MSYSKESEMYPDVCQWLQNFLQTRHKKARVEVFDSSQKSLVRLIREKQLFKHLSCSSSKLVCGDCKGAGRGE
jgi:hypothetical protein